jgi:hypothetical protein
MVIPFFLMKAMWLRCKGQRGRDWVSWKSRRIPSLLLYPFLCWSLSCEECEPFQSFWDSTGDHRSLRKTDIKVLIHWAAESVNPGSNPEFLPCETIRCLYCSRNHLVAYSVTCSGMMSTSAASPGAMPGFSCMHVPHYTTCTHAWHSSSSPCMVLVSTDSFVVFFWLSGRQA